VAWQRRVVSISRPSCDRGRVLTAQGGVVHRHEADGKPARQRMVNRSVRNISALLVEPHAGKRGHHLERRESAPYRVRFAARENRTPDPVACVRRVDEESPDLGRLRLRVEPGLVPFGARVAAEQCPPPGSSRRTRRCPVL
jgi:hypothetical protein